MITNISYDPANNEILVTYTGSPDEMEIQATPDGTTNWQTIYHDVPTNSFPNPLPDGDYQIKGRESDRGTTGPWSGNFSVHIDPD